MYMTMTVLKITCCLQLYFERLLLLNGLTKYFSFKSYVTSNVQDFGPSRSLLHNISKDKSIKKKVTINNFASIMHNKILIVFEMYRK